MPTLRLCGHRHTYPVSDILRLFYGAPVQTADDTLIAGPELPVIVSRQTSGGSGESRRAVVSESSDASGESAAADGSGEVGDTVLIRTETAAWTISREVSESMARREIKRQLYEVLVRLTGHAFPWGSLTGIRPTQVAGECLNHHRSLAEARHELIAHWHVSPEKADLALETAVAEQNLLGRIPAESLLVYMGVPFCPSRCAYCSFITQDAQQHRGRLEPYVEAMIKEALLFFSKVRQPVSALYFGGGTPTSLPDDLFRRLLRGIVPLMDLAADAEFTVEAGRPDTISEAKLTAIREAGATRLCINPQTFHDQTLQRIGRHHTTDQTIQAFHLARAMGFSSINMDLIAGLPGEEPADFAASLEQALLLQPDSLTIHTLAIKRSARLNQDPVRKKESGPDNLLFATPDIHKPVPELAAMLQAGSQSLRSAGLVPYYLYRQKDVAGGLENTGYARPGSGCLYNVGMMSDRRSVVGLGSGAISKRVFGTREKGQSGLRLDRLPNPRDIAVYIDRVDALAEGKIAFFTDDPNDRLLS